MKVRKCKSIGKDGDVDLLVAEIAVDRLEQLPEPNNAISGAVLCMSSIAQVIEESKFYMLNSKNEWKEMKRGDSA